MPRSRASAKKAGSSFERLIADYLAAKVDSHIDRQVKTGRFDLGDVKGLTFHDHKVAVEVKNTTKIDLPGWAAEAEAERLNLGALAGIIVHKRHGKTDPGLQWVTMTLDNFISLMTLARDKDSGTF